MQNITIGEIREKAKTNPILQELLDAYYELSKIRSSISMLKTSDIFDVIEKEELKKAYDSILKADNIMAKIEKEFKNS